MKLLLIAITCMTLTACSLLPDSGSVGVPEQQAIAGAAQVALDYYKAKLEEAQKKNNDLAVENAQLKQVIKEKKLVK